MWKCFSPFTRFINRPEPPESKTEIEPFNLLALPYVPRREVILNMSMPNLLIFSILSTLTKELVQRERIPVAIQIFINHRGGKVNVRRDKKTFTFVFHRESTFFYYQPKAKSGVKLINHANKVLWSSWVCNTSNVVGNIENYVTYLMELFKVTIELVSWSNIKRKTSLVASFEKMQITNLKHLSLTSGTGRCPSNVDTLLTSVKVKEALILRLNAPDTFATSHKFHVESLRVHSAFWFTRRNLLAVNCQFILLTGTELTSDDLNLFLKFWIKGYFKSLRMLECPTMFYGDYLKGLTYRPYDHNKNEIYNVGYFKLDERKLDTYFDIKRRDGTIGTVVNNNSSNFKFAVWGSWAKKIRFDDVC